MAVLHCSNCGAPRNPRVVQCEYCGVHFADPRTGSALSGIDPAIEHLLRQKNKIGAIKLYKEKTGMGLKESKDAVESIEKRLRL